MRVLLTGAAGFIGSHVARELVAREHTVTAPLLPGEPTDRISDLLPSLSVVEADLETSDLHSLVEDSDPDVCIHLGWYVDPRNYLSSVRGNLSSLVAGARLLSALDEAGCPRAVIAGTCLEPGTLIDGAVAKAGSIYAAAKSALHGVAMHLEHTEVACAHVFYLYGPDEKPERLVPSVIRACLGGDTIDVSAGQQRRDFLHVADVASGIVHIAQSDLRDRVDVCSGTSVPIRQVFEAIGAATGHPESIRIGSRQRSESEPEDIAGDSARLLGTGWRQKWSLAEGIANTVEWWQDRARMPRT